MLHSLAKIALVSTFIATVSAAAVAQDAGIEQDPILVNCKLTPSVPGAAADYPGDTNIIHSNKLATPAGKSLTANGEYVIITGRLTDENCVPISGAVVDMWQTDVNGKYGRASAGELLNPFPSFAGTGRATTDNLGNFRFETIFPGAYGKRAPHLHLRITHTDFATLATEMYFGGDRRNSGDAVLAKVPAKQRALLMGEVIPAQEGSGDSRLRVHYDIAMKGKNKYRRF